MDLDYPSIKNLFIEDSEGERFINNLPVNPPQGVGTWNQTMFAGNEYHLIVEAEDQNGWKDVEYIMVDLAPAEPSYDSVIWYFPRNDTAWTNSPFITLQTNPDGSVVPVSPLQIVRAAPLVANQTYMYSYLGHSCHGGPTVQLH